MSHLKDLFVKNGQKLFNIQGKFAGDILVPVYFI